MWVSIQGRIMEWSPENKPKRMTGICSDITKRKEAEASLNERKKNLEQMNKLMVGRELQMIELKKKLDEKNTLPTQ